MNEAVDVRREFVSAGGLMKRREFIAALGSARM
jgi:hypothetical protein